LTILSRNDIGHWAGNYLDTLADTRQQPGLLDGLRMQFGAMEVAFRICRHRG
jgi:trehalose 6-phosphate synthase